MDFKSFPFECKANLTDNTFEGYASVFNNMDDGKDIMEPGAFAETIKNDFTRIKALWMHDIYTPIGLPLQLSEDSKGLYVKGKVSQTSAGKDALILMSDGVVSEMSIGYDAVKYSFEDDPNDKWWPIRHLEKVKLWEFSPVTWGMNDLAAITAVKSRNGSQDVDTLVKRVFLLQKELKAGRMLSQANKDVVNQAIQALQSLIDTTEVNNDDDSTKSCTKCPNSCGNCTSDDCINCNVCDNCKDCVDSDEKAKKLNKKTDTKSKKESEELKAFLKTISIK